MKKYQEAAQEHFNETGYEEELTESNFIFPEESVYVDFGEETEEWDVAGEKPGLWENIRKKKKILVLINRKGKLLNFLSLLQLMNWLSRWGLKFRML